MGNQTKYTTYNALAESLKRAGFANYCKTATLMLETFVCNSGELRAGLVIERGLCKEGEFTKWRDELIQKGWLNYTVGDYSRHSPGPKLLKYINKEKISRDEVATMRDVKRVDDRVTLLELALKEMIEEFDPPVTEAKIKKRLKIVKT